MLGAHEFQQFFFSFPEDGHGGLVNYSPGTILRREVFFLLEPLCLDLPQTPNGDVIVRSALATGLA